MTVRSFIPSFPPAYAPAYSPTQGRRGETQFVFPTINNVMFDGSGTKSVSEWQNGSGFYPDLSQATATNQPSLSSGVYTFDGTDNYFTDESLTTTPAPDPADVVAVPDASGEVVGKGFTCTGLAKNLRTGELIVGNHGGQGVNDSSSLQQSVVTLSADGTTKIRENILGLGTNYSVQGVTYDNTRGTYWCEVSDIVGTNRTVRQYPVNATSDADLISSFAVDSDANGLAYNENTDELYVLRNGSGTRTVKRYDPADGSYLGDLCTLPASSTLDMLHYDPVNNILWHSKGSNGSNGIIQGYSLDGDYFGDNITLTDSLAIEGFIISTDGLTLEAVANDAWFHNGGAEVNNITFYNFDLREQVAKLRAISALQIDCVYKLNASTSSTEVLYGLGDPTSGLGFAVYQLGSNADTLRVLVHNGTTSEAVDLTFDADLTTESHITLAVDFANKSITARKNGVLQDTQTWTLAYTECRYVSQSVGGNYDGSGTRFLNCDIEELNVNFGLLSDAATNALGNTWDDGKAWTWTDIGGAGGASDLENTDGVALTNTDGATLENTDA